MHPVQEDGRATRLITARRSFVVLVSTASIAIILDQATKAVAVANLRDGESVPALGGVLHWTLQRNPGAAFGLFQRFPFVFTVLATVIAVVILATAWRARDRWTSLALGLVLGGAVGNLVDRIARPPANFRGHVIDFIDFRVWPTFNVADIAVVTGAALIALTSMRAAPKENPAEAAVADTDV